MINENFLKSVVDRIVANYEPEQILLFGSQAKNSANEASDVDLLIIKNTTLPKWRRGKNIKALFTNSPVKLDLLFYTTAEIEAERSQRFSFISSVFQSARIVYSRDKTSDLTNFDDWGPSKKKNGTT
jgi:predicted nucleotidyltransferase